MAFMGCLQAVAPNMSTEASPEMYRVFTNSTYRPGGGSSERGSGRREIMHRVEDVRERCTESSQTPHTDLVMGVVRGVAGGGR